MTPHKHAEVIKAWADGAEIQVRIPGSTFGWMDVSTVNKYVPSWSDIYEYRVKPTPKKCIPYKRYLSYSGGAGCAGVAYKDHTWNPEEHNGFIKWIDTEWQEHRYDA